MNIACQPGPGVRPLASKAVACVFSLLAAAGTPAACSGPGAAAEASASTVAGFVKAQYKRVLTFAGYSGAGYEDPAAMLEIARRVLKAERPARTLINIGATAEGIGQIYEVAKGLGFTTIGIVSTQARDQGVALSPCVDHVFFIADPSWGGVVPGTSRLSPTSATIVAISRRMVVIGGGDIARDEALAARRQGTPVRFFAADMNHRGALQKAQKNGLPEPTDFRGSAHVALAPGR